MTIRDEYGPSRIKMTEFSDNMDLMLINTPYAFVNNFDPQIRTLFRHMVEEARMAAGISRVPQEKIFINWDVAYGNTVRDKNTKTKGLAYWEPTRIDPKTRRKIGIRGKGKGQTYVTFFYHACQVLGV